VYFKTVLVYYKIQSNKIYNKNKIINKNKTIIISYFSLLFHKFYIILIIILVYCFTVCVSNMLKFNKIKDQYYKLSICCPGRAILIGQCVHWTVLHIAGNI